MKKKLLFLLVITLGMLLPVKAQTVYFSDGFENGFAEGWTQEYFDVVKAAWVTETPDISQPWKTESGDALNHPFNAVVGKGRAYFRQEPKEGKNVQTTGYRTRLITPVMDLSVGYQPILRFYHAQAKWTADFDTLRIYYRSGAGTQWNLLTEYTDYIQKWTFEEIDLPLAGVDYQLAFEANENMGRGIVLDSVLVRTKPQITVPHDIVTYDMRDNGVNVMWQASKDAEFFHFVMATRDLDLNVDPEAIHADSVIFMDSTVESSIQDIRVENLEPGQTYYIQIRSIGEFENSTWSPTFSFRVKPVKYVPYFENFNISYKSNAMSDLRLPTWTWGSSNGIDIGDAYAPVIPLWIGEEYFEFYSPDKTPAVAFIWQKTSSSGAFTTANNTMVPAGQFSYMASPEISGKGIDNFSMSMCHVTFWGTTYDKKQTYAQSIIVGVMEDPEDPTTFVAVDTCRVWGYKAFEFFDVDLSSYQGNGRYVAFASNFTDADNQYFIDDVTIELRPAVSAVSRQDVRVIPDTTAAALLWPAANGAVSYKVKYAKMESKGSNVPYLAEGWAGETVTTTKPEILLQNLTPRQQYIFTIQAVGADTLSAWSQPMNFYTSAEIELPYMTSFEEAEGTYSMEGAASVLYPINWLSYSNDADHPYLYTTYMRTGQRDMYMSKDPGNDSWMVSPMIENLMGQEMFFYLKASTTTYDGSKALVGVMEDPSDLSTFTQIAEFTATSADFVKCYVNFLNYQGPGKYIAIVWGEIGNGKNNTIVIDDLTIQELGSCFAPTLTVEGVTDNYAKISWLRKEPSDLYQVKVFTDFVKEAELETKTGNVLDIASQDSTNLVLDNINYATSYYVYVRVLCGTEDKSDWTMTSFKTECPAIMKLPFKDGFESCGTSSGNHPDCWTVPDWSAISTSGNNYPYGSTTHHSGAKSLYMYSYTTYGSMIAMPKLDADIADVKVSFWAYYSTAGYKVITGYMTDPNDLLTFVPVDTFLTTTSWTKHDVIFHGISGRDKYIAITTFTGAANYAYIDDVEVTDLTDAAPFNYHKKDATTSFMDFTWDGKTTGEWQIVASKTRYDLWKQAQTEEGKDTTVAFDPWTEIPEEDIVGKGQVAANEFIIPDGLEAMTWYYVYGHSTNGTDWSMDSVQTECTTWNPRIKMTEGFESYGPTATSTLTGTSGYEISPSWWQKALVPTCWTVGNARGCDPSSATTYTIRGYYPYVMSNGTVSVSGGKVTTTNYYNQGTALPGKTYGYAPNGCNSLKLYGYYSATASSNYAPAYAAMNKLECSDEDLKSLIITGSYKKANTAGYALIVGVMDDPTDLSTFTVLDSLTGGNGTSGTSQVVNFEVSLENYEGTGRYIAFRTSYGKTVTVYLDDISVSLASCPKPKPSVSGMTDNSAIISSGLKVENPWKYLVTGEKYNVDSLDQGKVPDAAITVVPMTQVGTWDDEAPKRVQVTGLAADSTYYVYVMTLCEGDESSAWVETSFTTLCEDKDITTWTYNFSEDGTASGTIPGCWTVGNTGPGAAATYIPYPQACAKLGKNGLKLYSYRASSTNANGAYAIAPGVAVPAGKKLQNYQVEFDAFGASTATSTSRTETKMYSYMVEVGVVEDPHDLSIIQMLDTIYLPLDVQHCVVPLDEYEGKGKFIIFKNEILFDTTATSYSYAWIGNIKFSELPACQVPTSLDITAVTANTVDLTWSGKSAQYKVALSSKQYADSIKDFIFANDSAIAADGIMMQTVASTQAHFEGLNGNTAYYAYVRGLCSDTEFSDWSYGALMLKTDCNPKESIPFRCDFNNNSATGAGKRPDCWLGVYHTFGSGTFNLTSYPYVLATASKAYGGVGYSLEMMSSSTYNNYSVLPMIDADLNEMMISFYATNYSAYAGRHVHIGYTTDWSSNQAIVDSCVFIGAIELPNSNVYTDKFEFHFADAEKKIPANARLILAANYTLDGLTSGSVDILIDNVYVGLPPTCYAPTNTSVSEVGFSAATFNFTPYKETDIAWDVELTNLVTNEVKMTTISKYPYQIEGLEAGTAYSVRVRTNCGDEDVSEWTDAKDFSTKYIIDTYKWTFTQDEQGTISVPSKEGAAVATYALHPALTIDCSDTTMHYSSNTTYLPYQIVNTTTLSYTSTNPEATSDERALRFYTTAIYDTAAVILPIISNPSDKMLSLDVRGGYMYSPEHSTESYRNTVGTYAYPNSILSIGTVDSLKGIETYQEIMKWQPSALLKNDTLHETSFYGWDHIILPLKDINLQQKQLVLLMGNCGTAYLHIDNLGIEKDTLGFTSPYINNYKVSDDNITLSWTGSATEYNIYKVDINKMGDKAPAFMPYLQDAPDSIVTKIEHVTGNTYKVEGLEPGMQYEFYVEDAAHAGIRGSLSNRKIVKTVCQAMNGAGFATSFELGPDDKIDTNPAKSSLTNYYWQWPTSVTASDTAYLMPNCWNYGITYASYDKESTTYKSYNPSVKQKTSSYAYALTGRNAFQFYGTSTYKEVYAVMPLLNNIDFDTTEVCFYGRCSYEYSDEYSTASYRGRMYTTSYLKGTSYSTKLAVGTMTDPEDISTFVALDTVEYDYTSSDFTSGSSGTMAADDPAGLRFFQKFAVSLKGATGDYIAFKQVGYGYFYMDDLCLQKIQTPRKPYNLVISDVTSKTANVTWTGKMAGGKFVLELSTDKTNWVNVRRDTTETTSFHYDNLAVNQKYFVRVKQIETELGNTDYAHYEEFNTECEALNPNGYYTGFECNNENDKDPWSVIPGATGTNVNTMKQNQCWSYINQGTTQTVSSSYFPYNIVNTATSGYSHSGDYACKLYAYSTTSKNVIVSPLIDAEIGQPGVGFDTLQISFWACPSYHGLGTSTNKGKIASASGTTYAKYIEIGTCTDPTDPATYTVLQGWTYVVDGDNLKTGVKADETNDYAFRKVTVKLNKATGPYVFIRVNKDRPDKTFTYSTMYIDDLQFERLTNCEPATDLEAENITIKDADLSWNSEAMFFDLQVSTDGTFTDSDAVVLDTTGLDTAFCHVQGLEASKMYYFRVKSQCDEAGEDVSDWTVNAYFRTPFAPLFEEQFTTTDYLSENKGWKGAYGYADKIFAGKAQLRDTTTSGTYNSWYRVQNLVMSGYAVCGLLGYAAGANPTWPISSTYKTETYNQKYWLVSPAITLEEGKGDVQLSFLYGLANYYTTTNPITAYEHWNEGWDDQFMVIVSDDGGATWKRENAIIWNNETTNDPTDEHYVYGIGDYRLTSIPNQATEMNIDLSKYAGKTIKIAFYRESKETNSIYGVHLDRVHVNYVEKQHAAVTQCQYEDIEDVLGFTINGDTVSAGLHNLRRSILSSEQDTKDSLFTLEATYLDAPEYYYDITVCEGHPFSYMGFNEHSAPGTYRMKLVSQVTGCDSLVNFTIRHTPTYETVIDTTLCYGGTITVGNKVYDKAGYYVDTLQSCSNLGGCDSIVRLTLRITDAIRTIQNVSFCNGSEYVWHDPSGVYQDTTITTATIAQRVFTATNGCDSTVTLNAVVNYPQTVTIMDTICQGTSRRFAGNEYTESGTYEYTTQSKLTGCDSTTVLKLYVEPAPVDYRNVAICDGETYTIFTKKVSIAGIYRDTMYNEQGCMEIAEVHLSINPIYNQSMGVKYINEGDEFNFFSQKLKKSGQYSETLQTVTGCDSIWTVSLVVLTDTVGSENYTICESQLPFVWKGNSYTKAGVYNFDTLTAHQTDSVVILTLDVIPTKRNTIVADFCEGGSYNFNGSILTTAGTYYDTIPVCSTGCDSIVILSLNRIPAPVTKQNAAICEGGSYEFAGKQLTTAGVYRDTTYAEETHCMAITELTLTVNRPVFVNLNVGICEGESYDFNGETLTETCNRSMTVPSVITGCDSTTNLALIVYPKSNITIPASICEGDSLEAPDGTFLTKAGEYTFNLTSVTTGCDSIVTINLKVNAPKHETRDIAICHGSTYLFNGKELNEAGTYYDTVPDVNGCMAVITLNLTINEPLTGVHRAEFCSEYTYQGKTYTDAGTYQVELKTEAGCDSIVSLILVQTKDVHDTLHVTVCKGETYEDENFSVSEPGVYYTESTLSGGCTGYHVLYFDNYPDEMNVDTTVLLQDLPYSYPGTSIYYSAQTAVGDYKDDAIMVSEQGCNVTLHHTLHVRESTSIIDIYYDADGEQVLKVIRKEHLYIIRKGVWYDATGRRVEMPE
ncbi:MAG: fibronectin type III domain-containing protein [Paludibacteraceae bacterium]|nr:fibronectin type III domain-containing protein [Paludibacteraceae bacterium]